MICRRKAPFSLLVLAFFCVSLTPAFSSADPSLLDVTPAVREYAVHTVRPVLDTCTNRDRLSLLLKVSEILTDPETGVQTNAVGPGKFMIYDKLDKIKLGFLATLGLSAEQKQVVKAWREKFMRDNPADVFFAPSADDIISTKAAFGCSHYARSFMAVVKALGLIEKPEDLRYAVSAKADDYNEALAEKDLERTINGHQFVLLKQAVGWIAINTSKSEYTPMPEGFSPDGIRPPQNIPVRFASYPDVTFLLRKIGTDSNHDCSDDSLAGLMNIYRSGDAHTPDFKWEPYLSADHPEKQEQR